MSFPAEDRTPAIRSSASRKALAAFFLSGVSLASLGPVLPVWGMHLRSDFSVIGNYFLCIAVGQAIGLRLAGLWTSRKGPDVVLHAGAAGMTGSFLLLALAPPPAPDGYREFGLWLLGGASGLLHAAVFEGLGSLYHLDAPSAINLAGVMFGLGCLSSSLLVAATFYTASTSGILLWLALVPALFLLAYWRTPLNRTLPEPMPWREAVPDFRSPGSFLFSLLLFCQFGMEWCVGGWLPLFLIQRIGLNPTSSILLLAFYWAGLLLGRIAVQDLITRFHHGLLVAASFACIFFGCVFLSTTNNLTGSLLGLSLTAAGYAAVYPIAISRFGGQLPYYHPRIFAGLFSFAVFGGLFTAFVLGKLAETAGIRVLMLPSFFGSLAVVLLILLLTLESKLHHMLRARAAR